MRRSSILLAVAVATLACAADAHAAAPTKANWNTSEQRAVAASGVMPRLSDGRFHGERDLTGSELTGALAAIAPAAGQPPLAADSAATVSVTSFDARLVDQLGLADVAAHVQDVAHGAGLHPPSTFGTEVVARFLNLRIDHPAPYDDLELYPWDSITRAEAAHSFAVLAQSGSWAVGSARAQLMSFALPAYTAAERSALSLAVSKIGMPYVWGGETDDASNLYGPQVHGGYDCSGFVWRVFKLSGNPAGRAIGGRTAAQMAGEIPKSQRIAFSDVRPGDLLFFGTAHFNSKATEANVIHVGIALSPQWMIHSSAQGVYISSLDDSWRQGEFAWARRVL
jgi:cell wall-associated NlpC family hydrolase